MDQERFEEIDRILEAALKIEPKAQDDFLKHVCAGDDDLRREVQFLLSQRNKALKMEVPAIAYVAEELAARADVIIVGQPIGHYVIKEQIGMGGMGEVWKARDRSLDRDVAIKILPLEFSADPDRVRRFGQEARAASALNHPNIITVHEVGQSGSIHFIAMEYVDGQTLRKLLSVDRLSTPAALDIAIQIASALAAAHEAGIIHRDIKPENIMLRPDGYVKTLDFGLAKLKQWDVEAERQGGGELEGRSAGETHTIAGAVMGTVRYMSPEQASGLPVDHRTDLFSLGVALHEMITNRQLFEGETKTEIIASILEKEPPQLRRLSPEAPDELETILSRALRKERTERYQTAGEMLHDLKRLKQKLELMSLAESGIQSDSTSDARSEDRARAPSRTKTAFHRKAGLALLVIAATGAIVWGARLVILNRQPQTKTMKTTKLTALRNVLSAAISSDGRRVAYILGESAGRHSIWVREVATTNSAQLVEFDGRDDYRGLTFSPDGREIYYIRFDEERDLRALYRIPTSGGTTRKVLDHVDHAIAFSPDGAWFAFVRYGYQQRESALFVADVNGGGERRLVTRQEPEILGFGYEKWAINGRLAWSPNGNEIAYTAGTGEKDNDLQVWTIPAAGGTERLLSPQKWSHVSSIAWPGDGDELVLLASDVRFTPHQIWHLPLSGRQPRKLTDTSDGYESMSVTADGSALAALQAGELTSIWVAQSADLGRATEILSGRRDGLFGLAWTTDGKILYDSYANGLQEIWIMDDDGRNRRHLTSGTAADDAPEASPDGRYIVYSSRRSVNDLTHIWRMDRDGGNPKQLTFASNEYESSCSPDSQWVVYILTSSSGKMSVCKTPIDGGSTIQLTAEDVENPSPAISPDGRLLAYYHGLGNEKKQIEIIPFDGGRPIKIIAVPRTAYLLRWASDGRALTYAEARGGVSNIWRQPLNGAAPKQMTFFTTDHVSLFDWSSDGRRLACSRHAEYRDVTLVRDFK